MTTLTYGNKTTINIERQREINAIMDSLKEGSEQYRGYMAELRELNVHHGDTVPDHIYFNPAFESEIVPAQIEYIKANTNKTASQLMPELERIAKQFADF